MTGCSRKNRRSESEKHILKMARDIGLDMDRLQEDLDNPDTLAHVNADIAEGRRHGCQRDADDLCGWRAL